MKNSAKNFNDFMIWANIKVHKSGLPNFKGECIQILSNFKYDYIEKMLANYHDKEIMDLLKFGFLLSHNGVSGLKAIPKNHKGVRDWPEQMQKILNKEINLKAAIGPFDKSPFSLH